MSYHSRIAKDRFDASTVFMLCVLGDDVLVKGGLADAGDRCRGTITAI